MNFKSLIIFGFLFSSHYSIALTRSIPFVGMADVNFTAVENAPSSVTDFIHLTCSVTIANVSNRGVQQTVKVNPSKFRFDYVSATGVQPVVGNAQVNNIQTRSLMSSGRASSHSSLNSDQGVAQLRTIKEAAANSVRASKQLLLSFKRKPGVSPVNKGKVVCSGVIDVDSPTAQSNTPGAVIASGVIEYVANHGDEYDGINYRVKEYGTSCPGTASGGSHVTTPSDLTLINKPVVDVTSAFLAYTLKSQGDGINWPPGSDTEWSFFGILGAGVAGITTPPGSLLDNLTNHFCSPPVCYGYDAWQPDRRPASDSSAWIKSDIEFVKAPGFDPDKSTQGEIGSKCFYGNVMEVSAGSFKPLIYSNGTHPQSSSVAIGSPTLAPSITDAPQMVKGSLVQQIANAQFLINGGKPF